MTFTDDDLKEVKQSGMITIGELKALLARLEAAEEIHENHAGHDEDCDEAQHGDKCSCGFEAAEIKWAKAAGK